MDVNCDKRTKKGGRQTTPSTVIVAAAQLPRPTMEAWSKGRKSRLKPILHMPDSFLAMLLFNRHVSYSPRNVRHHRNGLLFSPTLPRAFQPHESMAQLLIREVEETDLDGLVRLDKESAMDGSADW